MTVQVRVMAAQANRELALVQAQLRATAATSAMTGGRMTSAFAGASSALVKWGSQLQWAGRQMQYNFTIPLAIAGLAAAKFALDNERSMVLVKKVYGDMEHSATTLSKEVDALGEAFVALSNHFGVNQSEVIKVAADWAAAGSSGLALAKATRLTLELMILGEMEAADATQALIAVQAQYGLTVEGLAKAIDILNVVENQTGATMADLITGMAKSAGVARTAGVDVNHLAAMMAALVPAAGSATVAGNGLKTIISRLLSPTQDAADLMRDMKMNVEDLAWQSKNGTQRLETFAQAFDKLSDSQKTQVTSTVAGRWQINRFDVLMRDIINPLGYYQKALAAASDEQVNFNQRQYELNQVLSSNPQRLKQMWTMLQNALADVVQPMLPWIVLLAQKVAELFTWFSRLNPSIQKLVLGGLAFIAAFGLVARYVGVTAVLVGYLGKAFLSALGSIAAIGKGLWFLVTLPFKLIGIAFAGIIGIVSRAVPLLLAALSSPWTIAIAAVVALLFAFRDNIANWWKDLVDSFKTNGSNIANAFRPVVDFFYACVTAIQKAFNSLPQGVQNAIMSVVDIVKRAALQVYEWFSYLNPFASHSPSLVDSVTNGMAVIVRQYKSVGNVGAVFAKAASDLEAYKNLAASLNWDEWTSERADVVALLPAGLGLFNQLVEDLKPLNALLDEQNRLVSDQEKVVNSWKLQLNAANEALDQQEFILGNLKAQLDAIQASYDGHKAAMEDFVSAGIEGQRAMSDAIFENEMAQKRLRLEIMQLEDAGGGVDDLLNRMSLLQGEIETLRGSANDLRAAGAGSDVLGPVNAQIAAMEVAYAAMSSGAGSSPINALQQQLEELQRQGEMLDLENSINFDPLERQIDQVINGMNEMPFDEIIAGIQTERAAMDALQPSLDAATQAYNDQKAIVDQYQAARDTLQRSYDLENNKLQYLRDEYAMTADAISDIEEALRMVTGAAEAAGGALGGVGGAGGGSNLVPAADWEDVGGGAGLGREGTWDDQSAQIEEWTQSLIDETTAGLDKFDMFAPLREKWDSFVAWWNANAIPAWQGFLDGMGQIGNTLGENINFSGIGDWFGDVWSNIQDFWDSVQPFIAALGELFGPQLEEIWDRIVEAVGPVWTMLKEEFDKWGPTLKSIGVFFTDLWNNVLKPLGAWIGTVLIGTLSTVFSVIGNVIGPVITFIGNAIANIIQFIRGIIDFLIGIFTGDFQGALDGLSTAWGAVWSFVVNVLQGAWDIVYGILSGVIEGFVDFFTYLWDLADEHIGGTVRTVIDWFGRLWQNIKDWGTNVWNTIKDTWETIRLTIWNKIVEIVTNVYNKFEEIRLTIWNKIVEIITNVYNKFEEIRLTIWNKIVEIVTNVRNMFEEIRLAIWNKIVEIVTNVRNKFEEIRTSIWDKITAVRDTVAEVFGTVRDTIMGAFETVRDRIGGVFDSITNFIKSGINVGIRAVNGLISGLNTVADILPGLDWHISAIPLLAQGGTIPGRQVSAGFKANQARAIVGEGNSNYPEYVIPTDPRYRDHAEDLFSQLAKQLDMGTDDPRLGIGGWDDIVSAVGNAIGNGVDLLQEGAEWVGDAARGAVSKIMEPIKNMAQDQINGMTWDMGKSWAQSGLDNIWQWVTGADDAYKNAGTQVGSAWKKPLDSYTISSQYGMRTHPITGLRILHSGLDMATVSGSPIYAASTGQLSRDTMAGGLGKYMSIAHNNGMTSMYGHMSSFVKANGMVTLGQLIGRVGSTGNSTGPHLHFELRQNGSAIDPRSYMSTKGIALAGGGIVRRQAGGIMANLGEGRYDEAVVPLPNNWQSIGSRIATMTVQRLAVVGSIEGRGVETLQPTTRIENNTYNFYGDLEFPNVTNGDDAEVFLDNLSTLAGGSN